MISRDVKVGAFVLASALILGGVVFLIGSEAQLFAGHREIVASFKDVQGLSRGSPVRMGGVDIGRVVDVHYGGNAKDDTIFVKMSIVASEARRIRRDSVATVEGKGLLGDKMITVTVGSSAEPELNVDGRIKSSESRDFADIIEDLKSTMAGAERVVANLEKTTDALADESLHTDVKQAVKHLSSILEAMDSGDGYVGRLLHDKAEADRLSATVESLRLSGVQLEQLLGSTNKLVHRVETGPGFAHELLYEEGGTKAIAQVGKAAEEMGLALKGVREGDSFAHGMLYDDESGRMVDNLNEASADLKEIMKGVREGKGTMGALLVDPSVYEDLKVLLGNVGRNRTLRSLVRYSIARDEETGRTKDGAAASAPPKSAP